MTVGCSPPALAGGWMRRGRSRAHGFGPSRSLNDMNGFVSLVGAGPGDPDLLTQRAVRRLAEADVVFYDALVSPEVLPLAPHAQRFSVGKRAGGIR